MSHVLSKKKKSELQDVAEELDLDITGTKEKLEARILEFLQSPAADESQRRAYLGEDENGGTPAQSRNRSTRGRSAAPEETPSQRSPSKSPKKALISKGLKATEALREKAEEVYGNVRGSARRAAGAVADAVDEHADIDLRNTSPKKALAKGYSKVANKVEREGGIVAFANKICADVTGDIQRLLGSPLGIIVILAAVEYFFFWTAHFAFTQKYKVKFLGFKATVPYPDLASLFRFRSFWMPLMVWIIFLNALPAYIARIVKAGSDKPVSLLTWAAVRVLFVMIATDRRHSAAVDTIFYYLPAPIFYLTSAAGAAFYLAKRNDII